MNRVFASSHDFRQSLNIRLGRFAENSGVDVQLVRRRVAFDRFLARLQHSASSPWVLKGGHAMELLLKPGLLPIPSSRVPYFE